MDATHATLTPQQPSPLTASLEDYLETIKMLIDEDPHGHAHTSTIAKRLNVKMPSVTNALGVLHRNGYIHYDTNYPVTLTPLGEHTAKRILRRHHVLSNFLEDILQMKTEEASELACKIEHVISDNFILRLELLSSAITSSDNATELLKRMKQLN
ncbi:MAG: metal-dependent transcriptional regulator [bacterium]|nr:metal-dependent transcriptional regulator [bacterium]MDO5462833.1 metal-dependent transcriptional regulator [bacterium]